MSTDATAYAESGRRQQKARTRQALVAAARELLTAGVTPTVEQAAEAAAVSRTTAYRYFSTQRSLLIAAHPEIDRESLLPDDAPTDPVARLDIVVAGLTRITLDWEQQLRTSLRLSLEPGVDPQGPVLRRGRAIGWILDAVAPLQDTHPALDRERLALAIRSATGIESFVWLTDVGGASRQDAAEIMQWSARALLRTALVESGHLTAEQAPARRP